MALDLIWPWDAQPDAGAEPLYKPVLAWNLVGGLVDVSGTHGHGTLNNGAAQRLTAGGFGLYCSGGSNSATLARASIQSERLAALFGTQPTTIVHAFRPIAFAHGALAGVGTPSTNKLRFEYARTSGGTAFEFFTRVGGTFYVGTWSGAQPVANTQHVYVILYDGNGTLRLIKDGIDFGTQSISTSNFPSSTGESFYLGAARASSTNTNFYGAEADHYLWVAYDQEFALDFAKEISLSPAAACRALFAPRRVMVQVAGGTDYPTTQTEAATGSDTTSCLIGYAPAATEAGSASDAAAAAMAAVVEIIEAASAADSANGTASGDYTVTITETTSAASLEAAVSNYLAAISESASATDSASASLPGEYSVSISEAASAIETAAQMAAMSVAIIEAASASDLASIFSGAEDDLYPLAGLNQGYPLAGLSQTYPLANA